MRMISPKYHLMLDKSRIITKFIIYDIVESKYINEL